MDTIRRRNFHASATPSHPEEQHFMTCFKLMLMDGFMVKKYHQRRWPPYYQFRMFYYRPLSNAIEYESGFLRQIKTIRLKDIMDITKWEENKSENHSFTKEGMKKNIQIHVQSDTHLPRVIHIGFFDEETRDVFHDGLHLIYQEYRRAQASYRRSLIQRVIQEVATDSDQQD